MLLRNASPQDLDPDIFHTMTAHIRSPTPPPPAADTFHSANDYGNNLSYNGSNNSLDDIWADDTSSYQPLPSSHHDASDPYQLPHHQHQHQPHHPYPHHLRPEVSDVPRLQAAHATAGYRDGVAAGKARTAQAGFDEGYGLGATIGARAGQLLGVLEGLAAAVGLHALSRASGSSSTSSSSSSPSSLSSSSLPPSSSPPSTSPPSSSALWGGAAVAEARRIERLLHEARRELGVGGVFAGQFWAPDGTWAYQVPHEGGGAASAAAAGGGAGGGDRRITGAGDLVDGGGEEAVVFADVAEAHPLLRKWSRIVRAEAARYGVDWAVLREEAGEARRGDEGENEQEREGRMRRDRGREPAARGREALAW